LALLVCPAAATAADSLVTVTLLEGPATLIRGVARYALAEGVRLQSGDIIEVGEKGLSELEFTDGMSLALGPKSRALALSVPRGRPAPANFYVTQGAAKLAGMQKGARVGIVTPLFTLQPQDGAAVILLSGAEGSAFIEAGEARLVEPSARGAPLRLRSGEYYTARPGQRATTASRPAKAFVDALPRLFLDPLPSRLARFKDRQVQPRRLDLVDYAEVETWLKAPLAIRRPMLARFRSRADNAAFRAALVENLRFHPEWDPVLFPEKYQPKEPEAEVARGAPAPAAPAGPAGKR
jgi:hypothetical protein